MMGCPDVDVDASVDVEVVIEVVVEVDIEADVTVVVDVKNNHQLDVADLNTHCRCTTPPPSTTLSSSRSRTYSQLSYRWAGFETFFSFLTFSMTIVRSCPLLHKSGKWRVLPGGAGG